MLPCSMSLFYCNYIPGTTAGLGCIHDPVDAKPYPGKHFRLQALVVISNKYSSQGFSC